MNALLNWLRRGDAFIWLTGAVLAFCLVMIAGLVGYIGVRALGFFWPNPIVQVETPEGPLLGEIAGYEPKTAHDQEKLQLRLGNRDLFGQDFRWIESAQIQSSSQSADAVLVERSEYGVFIGSVAALLKDGQPVSEGDQALLQTTRELSGVQKLAKRIHRIEKRDVGGVNTAMDALVLERRSLERHGTLTPEMAAALDAKFQDLNQKYDRLQSEISALRGQASAFTLRLHAINGMEKEIPLASVVRLLQPNRMGVLAKLSVYLSRSWEFVADDPRESNTEGGIFPALFGTVLMVMLMSILVVPLGVVASLYLREYAKDGWLVRTVRIAVNNLAGVPSIVFGVFGLGFFVYALGGSLDALFFRDKLPTPTFGTGGILWASMTLALLTVPVVIVSTEEALAAVPRIQREASIALGATQWQTIWKVVLPGASPGILTGLILAMARGAGEVAPLMITGVVKLAPALPLDGSYPFMHLDRKFMHLGFHIYDVGFQSPNSEAAKPMVFMAALLLLAVVVLLNLFAIKIRARLRARAGGGAF